MGISNLFRKPRTLWPESLHVTSLHGAPISNPCVMSCTTSFPSQEYPEVLLPLWASATRFWTWTKWQPMAASLVFTMVASSWPKTGSSWKGSDRNGTQEALNTKLAPLTLHDLQNPWKSRHSQLGIHLVTFLRIWAARLQRSCRRSERRTHLIGGITWKSFHGQNCQDLVIQPAPKGSCCCKYFQTLCPAHTSNPHKPWFSVFVFCKKNIPTISYLFFSRCSLFFLARNAAANRRRPRGSMFWFTSYLGSFHLNFL